jgi:agmatinase
MTDRSQPDFAELNGWDREVVSFSGPGEPSYVGSPTYCKRDLVTDIAELAQRRADVAIVGAPYDDGSSFRPGSRFGPRAIRAATYTPGSYSLQLDVSPWAHLDVVDCGDADITPAWLERSHAVIFRRVFEVARTGAIPIILGGDHSITWPAASAVAQAKAPRSVGIVHFDAHADTGDSTWGVLSEHGSPMRRLIESGAVPGRNFVQVGLRGYWPPPTVLDWMKEQGMRWHLMTEIEERGADAVVDDAISEALDGPDVVYLSVDIDVIDPGMAPGTGTPEPGGMLTRELLRSVRRIASAVRLAGMDLVEVSPPYDHAETTSAAAHRVVLEVISALAVRRRDGHEVRFAIEDGIRSPGDG